MLKWAVNGPRQSYAQATDDAPQLPQPQRRRRLKRKSSEVAAVKRKTVWLDKENQLTSTPLHCAATRDSPSRKLGSLKDLSNIVLEPSPNETPSLPKTPHIASGVQGRSNLPSHYASTLPTFDVEYSPCSLVPGPVLALRGIGIADSYFEKPRYITQHTKHLTPPTGGAEKALPVPHRAMCRIDGNSTHATLKHGRCVEESSLSSSKMGDTTLERMIDAILESTRKERKNHKATKHPVLARNMSPTYTPADDPASDLNEVWDSQSARYLQQERDMRLQISRKRLFNEREVRSPCSQRDRRDFQLRRQRVVRRKRRITQITSGVRNSAQKHREAISTQQAPGKDPLREEAAQEERLVTDVSPDSGHNSSSDFEGDGSTLEGSHHGSSASGLDKCLDSTKRRLSFSL